MVAGLLLALTVLALFLMLPRSPGDDSVEAGFARDMSEHHAQAVAMAMEAIQDSQSKDLDLLAYDIATAQSGQIGRMQAWLSAWNLPPARSDPRMQWMPAGASGHTAHAAGQDEGVQVATATAEPGSPAYRPMPGMASLTEMEQLKSAAGEEAEILFLQLMTTHHIAGVQMAQGALDGASDSEVIRLAESMVNGQRSEIELMATMLTKRGAQPREDLAALGY